MKSATLFYYVKLKNKHLIVSIYKSYENCLRAQFNFLNNEVIAITTFIII